MSLNLKGKATGEGAGRSYLGGSALRELCSQSYRDRSAGPVRLKRANTTHIEMQIPVIIVALTSGSFLIAFDNMIILR